MSQHTQNNEQGQVMVLGAILMSIFMIAAAFAIDGGFGLFQSRQAQNAADLAALAGSRLTPCNTTSAVTGSQVQQVMQDLVNDNDTSAGTNWTAKYLDGSGNAISGASFSGTTTYAPPASSCGVSVSVKGTWNTTLAKIAGINSASTTQTTAALGSGQEGVNLAIASLLPYARHTIYAGAIGNFKVVGSMFDNSIDQCNDRDDSCANYSQCLTGTPLNNIVCYADSADVFQESTEQITGTLYSVAPVATDPCFYPSPTSGNDPVMTQSAYPSYYNTYGCDNGFSQATNAIAYGGIQGNVSLVGDPLASLSDPSGNSGAATECNGASSPTDYSTSTVSSGSLNPGVYTNPVIVTGSVTFNACMSSGSVTSPGIYVFQQGLEVCPTSGSTVTGTDVMLYSSTAPSATYGGSQPNTGYCTPDGGSSNNPTDGISIGGASGSTVTFSAPDSGVYKGILLYQSRSNNQNIGLDDGWTTTQTTAAKGCRYNCTSTSYTPDGASITLTGVVYDNSFTNEPSTETFSAIGDTYGGPYGALCAGTTSDALSGDPTPCPGIPNSSADPSGTIAINGAVVVGAFGTMGGSTSNPLTLTITFKSTGTAISAGNLRLLF